MIRWIDFARTVLDDALKVLEDDSIRDSDKISVMTASIKGYQLVTQERAWAVCGECFGKVLLRRNEGGPEPEQIISHHKEGCSKR